jgi:hypothetical protein
MEQNLLVIIVTVICIFFYFLGFGAGSLGEKIERMVKK